MRTPEDPPISCIHLKLRAAWQIDSAKIDLPLLTWITLTVTLLTLFTSTEMNPFTPEPNVTVTELSNTADSPSYSVSVHLHGRSIPTTVYACVALLASRVYIDSSTFAV